MTEVSTDAPVGRCGGGSRRSTRRCCRALLAITVGLLVIPVSLQIFSRYTELIPSYIWTEEMARFMFIWTIMIGAMIGVRESTHFEVDVLAAGGAARRGRRAAARPSRRARGGARVRLRRHRVHAVRLEAHLGACRPAALVIHVAWPVTGVTWIVFLGEQVLDDLKIISGRS